MRDTGDGHHSYSHNTRSRVVSQCPSVSGAIPGGNVMNREGRWRSKRKPSYINLLQTKRRLLYLKTQSVPRSKHFSSGL